MDRPYVNISLLALNPEISYKNCSGYYFERHLEAPAALRGAKGVERRVGATAAIWDCQLDYRMQLYMGCVARMRSSRVKSITWNRKTKTWKARSQSR